MTTVTFYTEGGRITGFAAKGHSGWAEAGKDVLCAAVTSAVRLTECVVNDVLGLQASVRTDGQQAAISLRLPRGLDGGADTTCQDLLAGLMAYLSQLRDEYPGYLEVLEAG